MKIDFYKNTFNFKSKNQNEHKEIIKENKNNFGPYINEDIFTAAVKEDMDKTPLLKKFLKGYILDNEPPVDINNDPIKDRKIRSNILKAKNIRPVYVAPVTDVDRTMSNSWSGKISKKIQAKQTYEQAMHPFYEEHPMIQKLNKKRDIAEIAIGKNMVGFGQYQNNKEINDIIKAFSRKSYFYLVSETVDFIKNNTFIKKDPEIAVNSLYKKELKEILIVEKLQELIKNGKITGDDVYKKIINSLALINHSIKK